jgi:DNA-binding SARP family transcriptional activator
MVWLGKRWDVSSGVICDGFGASRGDAVRFQLLGPVEIRLPDRTVHAGEPRLRAVLAALLVNTGQVVSGDTLVDRVWGDQPPRQARDTLRTYVTRVRRLLDQVEPAGTSPPTVVRHHGGYRCDVDPDLVDLHRFRRLVGEARTAGPAGARSLGLLREALDLWQGDALAGVPGDWATRTREAWHRERLDAVVAWSRAELCTGDPARLPGPLGDLSVRHPEVEPLTAALMQALVALGRPTDALTQCLRHRQQLAEEYGTDQGAELTGLYQAIVRGDVAPALTASHGGTSTPGSARPRSQPEAPQPEAPRPGTPRPGTPRPEAPRPGTPRPEAPRPEAPTSADDGAASPAPSPAPPAGWSSHRGSGWARRRSSLAVTGSVVVALGVGAFALLGPAPSQRADVTNAAATSPDHEGRAEALDTEEFTAGEEGGSRWAPYELRRQNGSSWSPSMVRVEGGELQISGTGRNPTGRGNIAGGGCWCRDDAPMRRYGVWQVRAKFDVGGGYGPVIGLWPTEGDGEGWITLARVDQASRTTLYALVRTRDDHTVESEPVSADLTSWHTYSVEWRPDSVVLRLDDEVVLDTRGRIAPAAIPTSPMFLYAQLVPDPDGPVPAPDGETPSQVVMHVDWIRYHP